MYICNGILLSHEKNEILPFATTWMELLSERSQTVKYCIWNLKNEYNKTERDLQIQRREQQLLESMGRKQDRKGDWEIKLLCRKWRGYRSVLNSTGKYSHYFMVILNGV